MPHDPARVMGVAKDKQFAIFVYHALQILEIHRIAALFLLQRIIDDLAFHRFRDNPERMVNRRLDDDFIARLGEALHDKADSFDDARDISEPLLLRFPHIFILQPCQDAIPIRVVAESISHDRVFASFLDCIQNKVRSPEVHVCHPQRKQALLSRESVRHSVIFHTRRPIPVDYFIEIIEFHRILI